MAPGGKVMGEGPRRELRRLNSHHPANRGQNRMAFRMSVDNHCEVIASRHQQKIWKNERHDDEGPRIAAAGIDEGSGHIRARATTPRRRPVPPTDTSPPGMIRRYQNPIRKYWDSETPPCPSLSTLREHTVICQLGTNISHRSWKRYAPIWGRNKCLYFIASSVTLRESPC